MGYSGEQLLKPGFEVAFSTPFFHGYKLKERDTWFRGKLVKTKERDFYVVGSASAIWHMRSHTQITNSYGIGYSRVKNSRSAWFTDLQVGLSSFITSNNYTVSVNQQVERSGVQSNNYFMLQPSIGRSWLIRGGKTEFPLETVGTSLRIPLSIGYNSTILPQVVVGVYITFQSNRTQL